MKANEIIARSLRVIDKLDQEGQRLSALYCSHAGFGKTSTIRMYCDVMDYNLVTIIPSQSSADDILGIQAVDQQTGRLKRLTPSWFNRMVETMKNGKRTLLFIDEISTCDPYIQGPLLDLIFSHNLGDEVLPKNVFIVAAGNYSMDLNNDFRMSSPLVNRFVIINLQQSDYSIKEILQNKFEKLKTVAEKKKYLGIDKEEGGTYDFDKFSQWIRTSNEITYGKTQATEDEECGLFGFTSVRSLTYSLKFAAMYMNTFSDDSWIRIVGDTLGTSNKRNTSEDDGIPLRKVLSSKQSEFMVTVDNSDMSISEICESIKKTGFRLSDFVKISNYLDTHVNDDISNEDYLAWVGLSSNLPPEDLDNPIIGEITNKMLERFKA